MGDGPVFTFDNANSIDNVVVLALPLLRRIFGAALGRSNDTADDIISVIKMSLVQYQRSREGDRQHRD